MTAVPSGALPPVDVTGWVAADRSGDPNLSIHHTPFRQGERYMKQQAYASPMADTTARRDEICAVFGETYDPARWGDWRWQMRRRLTRLDPEDPACTLRLQVMPVEKELLVSPGDMADPCGEDHSSVVEGLVHRYPDRVLFL